MPLEDAARLHHFWELSPDPLCLLDLQGTLLEVNPRMVALTGRSEVDLEGTPFLDTFHPEERGVLETALAGLKDGARSENLAARVRGPDEAWLLWNLEREDQEVFAVARDITEARASAATRRRAETLAEVAHHQRMLLNAASHELRTPLTPLSMHLERLARTTDQTETVERAQRCVRRISVTIDALLETAGLTRAATHPKVCRTEMLPLVRGAFAEATGPDDLMAYVDPALMEQAIGALVRIEVQDDGPGFAQDEGESWFMPLHRNVQDDRGGKAGLGLSIVRLVAMAHGGKAGVSSPGPGQGTTVWIELPREG